MDKVNKEIYKILHDYECLGMDYQEPYYYMTDNSSINIVYDKYHNIIVYHNSIYIMSSTIELLNVYSTLNDKLPNNIFYYSYSKNFIFIQDFNFDEFCLYIYNKNCSKVHFSHQDIEDNFKIKMRKMRMGNILSDEENS